MSETFHRVGCKANEGGLCNCSEINRDLIAAYFKKAEAPEDKIQSRIHDDDLPGAVCLDDEIETTEDGGVVIEFVGPYRGLGPQMQRLLEQAEADKKLREEWRRLADAAAAKLGYPIIVDPTLPCDQVEVWGENGIVAKIVNIRSAQQGPDATAYIRVSLPEPDIALITRDIAGGTLR